MMFGYQIGMKGSTSTWEGCGVRDRSHAVQERYEALGLVAGTSAIFTDGASTKEKA